MHLMDDSLLVLGVRLAASELVAGRTPTIVHDAVTSRTVLAPAERSRSGTARGTRPSWRG